MRARGGKLETKYLCNKSCSSEGHSTLVPAVSWAGLCCFVPAVKLVRPIQAVTPELAADLRQQLLCLDSPSPAAVAAVCKSLLFSSLTQPVSPNCLCFSVFS